MGLEILREKEAKNIKTLKETTRITSCYETQAWSNLQLENQRKRP